MKESESSKSDLMFTILKSHLQKPEFTMEQVYALIMYSPLKKMRLESFCKEVLTMVSEDPVIKISKSTVEVFEVPEEGSSTRPSWREWPQDVKDEIMYVLEQNDSGKRKISMSDYLKRIRTDHGIDASDHGLKAFCKSLGRRGWTK